MILIENITQTSAFLQIYGLDGSMNQYGAYIEWTIGGIYYGASTIPAGTGVCNGITASGLTPGTTYSVIAHAYVYYQDGSVWDGGEDTSSFTTLAARPSAFSWAVPKVQGSQYYIGADEWYNLMANLQDVHKYATGSYYTFNQVVPEAGQIITADRYNDCRSCVQSIPGYGAYIPLVAAGDIVTAYQLNVLVSELNAVP